MSTGDVQAQDRPAPPVTDPLLLPDPLDGLEDDVPDLEELLPKVELIEEDGEPLESDWHRLAINLLLEVIAYQFRQRSDYGRERSEGERGESGKADSAGA